MPQSAQKHGDEEIQVPPSAAAPVAAQLHIEIVAQEGRQRNVPASPEFDDAGGFVRRVEVHRQPDTQHH